MAGTSPSDLPVITAEQHALWKHHPVTKVVFAFLKAYREQVLREHLDRFIAQVDEPKLEMKAVGIAHFVAEFLDLEFSSLQKAYEDVGDGTTDGRETEGPPDGEH